MNFDFAKNQKTVTGMAIMFLPLILTRLGLDISNDQITSWIAEMFQIVGSALALYGLIMKIVRSIKSAIKK